MSLVALAAVLLTQAPARVTIVFGGDVIPHEPVKAVASAHERTGEDGNHGGWDHILGPLAPALQHADVAVVNLETPVVTIKKPETGEMIFSAPPELLQALKRVGVDVATFANNHCLDQHREGIVSTREYLAQEGLLSAGSNIDEASAWTPLVFETNGLRIGILAVTRWLNGFNNKPDPLLPHVPAVPYAHEPIGGGRSIEGLLSTVKTLAPQVDVLLVSLHWGTEYKFVPTEEDRRLAKLLLDSGAFAVIGHHPHVLQPVEWIERSAGGKGLVVFSLGNLVSNQDFADPHGAKRDGLLIELELVREVADGPVRLNSVLAVPVTTENTLGRGRKRDVQARLLDDELAALDERLAELDGGVDVARVSERRRLEQKRTIALERRTRIESFLPPGVLPSRP